MRKSTLTLLIALLLLPAAAFGAEFKATIGFPFADDNVLRGPGETRRNSPSAYFGNTMGSPLDISFPGSIGGSSLNMMVYGRVGDKTLFVPDAAVVLKFDLASGKFKDYGTYLRINYLLAGVDNFDKKLSMEFFPINADRFKLGFADEIAWGGTDIFPKNLRSGLSKDAVPGLRIGLDLDSFYAFLGMKTALIMSPAEDILDNPGGNTNKFVERTHYGFLGGLGFDLLDGLTLEVNGGYFSKGTNTRANVLGKPIYAGGGSVRLAYSYGLPIGKRIDLRLYFQDPYKQDVFAKEDYDDKVSVTVTGEFTEVVQTLEDPDKIHSTKNEFSMAAHLGLKLKYGPWRVHLTGMYRDLTYILYNVPGFVPGQALPADIETTPEIYAAMSVDYFFEKINLTPSLTGGVIFPATYKGIVPEGTGADEVGLGILKIVVMGSDPADWSILPPGEDELPIGVGKFSLKWTYGDSFAAIGELVYTRNSNLAQVFRDAKGHAIRSFDKPDILGFALVAQMSF